MAERVDRRARNAWHNSGTSRTQSAPAGLSRAERDLWDAYPTGRTVDLTDRKEPLSRVVRASVLSQLLLGGCPARPGFVPAVRLKGAHITGRLDVSGGTIGCELKLDQCRLDAAPVFANTKTRQLRFRDCEMPGFDGGGLQCDGYLSLSGSTITGLLKLTRAQLLGGFRLNQAKVSNPEDPTDWAVFTGGMIVEAGAFIRNTEIIGGMRLVGARLNGGLFMEGSTVKGLNHHAIDAENLVATDAVELSNGFTAEGMIRLRGCRVTGVLSFSRAKLNSAKDRLALHLSHSRVDELNLWTDKRIEGGVSLAYSRVGVLMDSQESWPEILRLNGLTYDSLRGAPLESRLDWVRRDAKFSASPYEQLAKWYRLAGHDDLARETQLAKARGRRRLRRPPARLPGLALDWAIGYGHRPWRAALWFALLLASGTVVFSMHRPEQLQQPQDIPTFHAFAYTLDLLVPVPLFGQRDHWNPTGWTVWFSYFLIVSGWIFATALIAGATRILRPSSAE